MNTASPIRSGTDLVERLKKEPQSIAMGFPTALSQNHVGAALLLKAIGRKANEFKSVVFKGTSEAAVALLGGHIELHHQARRECEPARRGRTDAGDRRRGAAAV